MFRFAAAALVAAGLALVIPVKAGEFNKKFSIGDACPSSFKDLVNVVDDKKFGLDDLKAKDVIVVCVTCNHCPVAVAYEDRLIKFVKDHAGPDSKVGFVAISVNVGDDDGPDKMKERAKAKGFNFPYLYDGTQKTATDLGATKTPEFFVFGKDRKLIYQGAMDDDQKAPKTNYLEPAVKAGLAGKKVEMAETRPFGCGIKFKK